MSDGHDSRILRSVLILINSSTNRSRGNHKVVLNRSKDGTIFKKNFYFFGSRICIVDCTKETFHLSGCAECPSSVTKTLNSYYIYYTHLGYKEV